MSPMSLSASAVLDAGAFIDHRVQAKSHEPGWFAAVKVEDGQYGGHSVHLIVNDPAVLDALATAAATARDELIAAQATDQVPAVA